MNLRKIAVAAVAAFAVFFAITNPTTSADIIRTIASGIGAFASALAEGGN